MKTRVIFVLMSVLALLLMTGGAAARPLAAPISTVFTYQGRLTEGGSPATGDYDFEFGLYDASTGGTQFGSTIPLGSVAVLDGLFTVELDFGDQFDGTPLWLQIGVAPGGSGGPYTPLDPRQFLSGTPYAIYAAQAGSAPWDGLTGMPAGFADGVDNAGGASHQNLVVVAKSGGDFTTITAALNSITASDSSRYLIYVAPGVYTEQVMMEPYVDIQGSGELNTKITFTGGADFITGSTLKGADNAELRFLEVENTGGSFIAIASYNSGASPHLTHVTASVSGGTAANYGVYNDLASPTMSNMTVSASGGASENYGVYNYFSSPMMMNLTASASGGNNNLGVSNVSSSPTLTNITASATGGTSSFGVLNYLSSPTMTDVTANASGGTNSYGVFNNESSSLTMTNITASGSGGSADNYGVKSDLSSPTMTNVTSSASGGTNSYGVYNFSASPTMTDVTASASGGTNNYGVYNLQSSLTMTDVTASASGGSANYGVYNTAPGGSYNVLVNNSQITGSTSIRNMTLYTTRVGASLLSGGPVIGTVTCAGVYDEDYIFYASTCP